MSVGWTIFMGMLLIILVIILFVVMVMGLENESVNTETKITKKDLDVLNERIFDLEYDYKELASAMKTIEDELDMGIDGYGIYLGWRKSQKLRALFDYLKLEYQEKPSQEGYPKVVKTGRKK